MIRRTIAQARTLLAPFAGQCGMATDDDRVNPLINYVTETLLNEINGPQMIERVRFCNLSSCIVLPLEYEVALRFNVQANSTPIASQWYEFSAYGPGRQDGNYAYAGIPIDRGETPVIRNADTDDTDGGQLLRAYSFGDERVAGVAPYITVLAKDVNGRLLRNNDSGEWEDGIRLNLNGHSATNYTTSAVKISEVLGVIKPRTIYAVELHWEDSAGATHFAARYQYKDTMPMFRRYFCPGVAEDDEYISIHALCRRRFVAAVDDNDFLPVTSLRALRMGIRAAAEELKEGGDANRFWSDAVAALRAESEAWYGDQMGRVEYAPETGFGEECPVI